MTKLSGKIAIVTGGTGGLGKVVVERLLESGARVIATHTGSKKSVDVVAALQKRYLQMEGINVDVTSEDSVKKFYQEIHLRIGKIDILCNLVGGVNKKKFIDEITLDEWNKMMELNLLSCFLMVREVIQEMKNNGFGRIINIAAMPAIAPEAKRGGYGVAKAGVIALTKTVAEEVKEFGNITVNAIAPSIILTEENKTWGTEADFKKWVTPLQIAEMIDHLCSDAGVAINGHVIQMYGKV